MYNFYEEQEIANDKLPKKWQNIDIQNELSDFLQENWNNRYSFYDDANSSRKQQFLSFLAKGKARTNNYIGTIGFNGETINIFPKVFREKHFDNEDTTKLDKKHMIKNLVMWINYCNKTNYPFINFNTEYTDFTDLKELFIVLFINYLEYALARTIFMKYENIDEDISSIKGKLNIKDYVINKIPQGKPYLFNCSYSTFEYDNSVNRIIKYTCRLLLNITSFENQRKLRNIIIQLSDVSDIKCTPNDCNKIILRKDQEQYRVILALCKMFLMNNVSSFEIDSNSNYCFLFPTESLFEGFVGGFIADMLKDKATVILQKSSDYLFDHVLFGEEDFGQFKKLRYDIFVELKDSKKIFILDTKYKMLPQFSGNSTLKDELRDMLSSEDIYQVLEYANKNKLEDVYLLYPLIRSEQIESNHLIGQSFVKNGNVNVHIIKIPFIFEKDESKVINDLKSILISIFE